MLVLGDSCPLPTAGFEKKRKLSEKKFLIYAPMRSYHNCLWLFTRNQSSARTKVHIPGAGYLDMNNVLGDLLVPFQPQSPKRNENGTKKLLIYMHQWVTRPSRSHARERCCLGKSSRQLHQRKLGWYAFYCWIFFIIEFRFTNTSLSVPLCEDERMVMDFQDVSAALQNQVV